MADVHSYLKLISLHNQRKLDNELDFDNDFDRDLVEIAGHIHNWKVALKVPLGLSERDVRSIEQEQHPTLRL